MRHAILAGDSWQTVTIGDSSAIPGWTRLLGFPATGTRHVHFAGDTVQQRNLLGARIDEAVRAADRRVLLVAEGAACLAAAWWARLTPADYVARVRGALLFAPADARAGFASPAIGLPFPTIVIDEADDAARLAAEWGARLMPPPRHAHRPRAGWGTALQLFGRVTQAVVAHDIRTAERLLGQRE
ncbi:alpha/beta hydrolase [Sphingomonas baiyangensis]|uniref:Alpha/beta hydrolase n=1 Tax=Sphingomonas baiyangensis TaxID=2572576 RepID=A0A4U1L2H3_9SPHN|nr:alpha/beta hydrolase [Sphingomonas baiyangensis]TKD51077.1 hypothetical protein FBR43_10140 [Sphingomonas baiyangensis]